MRPSRAARPTAPRSRSCGRSARPPGRDPLRGARASARRADGRKPVASLLRLVLETGRTHQVRVHLGHIGHPLLGDQTYGAGFKASARKLEPRRHRRRWLRSAVRPCMRRSWPSCTRSRASGSLRHRRCRRTWPSWLPRSKAADPRTIRRSGNLCFTHNPDNPSPAALLLQRDAALAGGAAWACVLWFSA